MAEPFKWGHSRYLGRARAFNLYEYFTRCLNLHGDVAEFGVALGETSRELTRYIEHSGFDKKVHLFDNFRGLQMSDLGEFDCTPAKMAQIMKQERNSGRRAEDSLFGYGREEVESTLAGLSKYKIYEGDFYKFRYFSQPLCFVHVNADLYFATIMAIVIAERLIVPQGAFLFSGYGGDWPGVKKAVHERLDDSEWDISIKYFDSSSQCIAIRK